MQQGQVETSAFHETTISDGIRLLIAPSRKFKRTRVMIFVHNRLSSETSSLGALLPYVQKRGSRSYPSGIALERAAGDLYNAELSGGVHKIGDRQVISYSLDILDDKLAGEPILEDGLRLLKEMAYQPAIEEDGLVREYVDQEKRFQVGRLRALVNNKASYARHRCIEEMFPGEPFAEHELGTEERISAADPKALLERHRELVSKGPIDIYVVGDVDEERVEDLARRHLVPERAGAVSLPPSHVQAGSGPERNVVDEEPMNQGWLVLGLKSDIGRCNPNRYGLMFFNGILGGFVHSKMFINVRERASLAYSASSTLYGNKGIILAGAGIDVSKYDQALEITLKQIEDTKKGDYTDEELEATRRALSTRQRLQLDSPDGRILFHLGGAAEGCPESVEDALEAIASVDRKAIAEAGESVRLDTVYFLKGVL